ncbi:hypothetical protein HOY80DRAFT_1137082 [Tuber brumale]|nr:hypothetical protein HOY80DRAFT_1137082 [Tuber brumale]
MFPPGHGNDSLDVGDIYVISLFGRNEVFTPDSEREEICLREYQEGHRDQLWVCEKNSDNQIGMRNRQTGRLLGWIGDNNFGCVATLLLPDEGLTFTRLSLGGYSLWVRPDAGNKLRPVVHIDSITPHLKVVHEIWTHFGLHRIKHPVFRRFEWVVPGRLARSSAPYFDGDDSDESINQTSIEFLHHHQIKNIISLNSVELSPREKGRLRAANISYSHIRAVECAAVTQEQFDQIWNAYHKAGTTLVYCGYGDGRTGMAISAIQLFEGRTLSELDYRENGLQCHTQLAAVENHDDAGGTSDTQPPQYAGPEKKKL